MQCPTTKLSLLISKSFVGIKQSVVSIALKNPLKTRLGICIYKTSLPYRPDDLLVLHQAVSQHFTTKLRLWAYLALSYVHSPCVFMKLPFV